MNNYIKDFFNGFDLDVRKSRDARFMDQKVTPDVLYIVCICVLEYIKDDFENINICNVFNIYVFSFWN